MNTVNELKIGEKATVVSIGCKGALRRRIIDMGITPGAVVIMRKTAPLGDPIEINVRGYEPVSYTHLTLPTKRIV